MKTKKVLRKAILELWKSAQGGGQSFICLTSSLYEEVPDYAKGDVSVFAAIDGSNIGESFTPVKNYIPQNTYEEALKIIRGQKPYHIHIIIPQSVANTLGREAVSEAEDTFYADGHYGKVEIVNLGICYFDWVLGIDAPYTGIVRERE